MVELGGQGPLASSPLCVLTPIPSCPLLLAPQHLRLVSSCGEEQPSITQLFSIGFWAECFTEGFQR